MTLPVLSTTTNTVLSRKLGLATAYFQAGAAQLVSAEGDALSAMALAISAGKLAPSAITLTNKQITSTMLALSNLQTQIIGKISAATHVHDKWN